MEVIIGGNTYAVYADVPTATEYLTGQFSDDATAWLALSADQQAQTLVAMTRTLDRQSWQGEPTDPLHQALAWPRDGLSYPDGEPVDPLTIPQQIIDACCEGAAMIGNGSDLQNIQTTANTQRTIKAGSVMVENFRDIIGTSPRFPQVIQELIRFWFGGASTVQGSESTGTDRQAESRRKYDLDRGF